MASEFSDRNNDRGLVGGGMPDINRFRLGEPAKLVGSEMQKDTPVGSPAKLVATESQIPQSASELKSLGPDDGFSTRIGAEGKMMANGGGEEDMDPNKERMEHEMRMQEMFGEGRGGYLGEFLHGAKDLKKAKEDTSKLDDHIKIIKSIRDPMGIEEEDGKVFRRSKDDATAKTLLAEEIKKLDDLVKSGTFVDPGRQAMVEAELHAADLDLAQFDQEKERSVENIREKLAESYVNIIHSSLDEMNALNRFLEGLKNPYPYDSRWNIQFFEQSLKEISEKLRNKSRYDEEGVALLKMLKRDVVWAGTATKMVEAMGPAFELYFDGEMMLSRLRSPHTELLGRDFMRVFKKNLDGLDLSPAQTELAKKTLKKIDFKKVGIESDGDKERYKNLQEKGLREVAVEYQDRYDQLLLLTVAAGQKNLELGWNESAKPETAEEGEHYAKIDEITLRFLSEVFAANLDEGKSGDLIYIATDGSKYRVKDALLNPFCMPRNDERANMAYQSRMHELVVRKDYFDKKILEIKNNRGSLSSDDLSKAISGLATEVVNEGNNRIKNWEALDEQNPYDRLADTIIKNMTNLSKGTLEGGDLGWSWVYEKSGGMGVGSDAVDGEFIYEWKKDGEASSKYKKDVFDQTKYFKKNMPETEWKVLNSKLDEFVRLKAKGIVQPEVQTTDPADKLNGLNVEFIVKRKSELGSIYDNHDVTTVMFLARHIVDYDNLAETRSTIFPPTIGWYRDRWASEAPYWRPKLEEFASNDKNLLRRIGLEGDIGIIGKNNLLEKQIARKAYAKGFNGQIEQTYGKFDKGTADFIKENVWAFVTPFLEKPGDPNSDYVVLPIFIPTQIKDMTFSRMTTLMEPNAKVRDFKKGSIWHQRLAGTKYSDLKWENMDKYKYNWIEVTGDQMVRWLGPLITPADFNKGSAAEVEKHYLDPSGLSEKEGGKRMRLGGRGGLVAEGVLRAAVSSQNKIISSMKYSTVLSTEYDKPGLVLFNKEIQKWADTWVAPWANVLLDMPAVVRGCNNYNGTSAQVAIVTAYQMEKLIRSMIIHSDLQKQNVAKSYQQVKQLKYV